MTLSTVQLNIFYTDKIVAAWLGLKELSAASIFHARGSLSGRTARFLDYLRRD